MKQGKAVNAYKTLCKLSNKQLRLKTAYEIYVLKNKLKEIYDFQIEQEKKLIEEYGARFSEDGKLQFCNTEDATNFMKMINEISELDCEIEYMPVSISSDEDIMISIDEIENLKGFVEFRME